MQVRGGLDASQTADVDVRHGRRLDVRARAGAALHPSGEYQLGEGVGDQARADALLSGEDDGGPRVSGWLAQREMRPTEQGFTDETPEPGPVADVNR